MSRSFIFSYGGFLNACDDERGPKPFTMTEIYKMMPTTWFWVGYARTNRQTDDFIMRSRGRLFLNEWI